ncbi:class I SAM-dependent methyltransferase [Methylomagnum sp.]
MFSIDDYRAGITTTMNISNDGQYLSPLARLKRFLAGTLPDGSYSAMDLPMTEVLRRVNEACSGRPSILVIGAGDHVMELPDDGVILYTDVALGTLTHLVCDAHDLPFVDDSFDAVIVNAVLEHVADPYRCVEEIHRVLRQGAHVFSVTPFMQQVHMGRYDFTRFTHLGHRRLFRRFTEECSGVANGPAMVMTWSFERFMAGFAGNNKWGYSKLRTLARLLVFPIKYFDRWLARCPAAYDSASAFYFLGRKSDTVLSDRELIRQYRGLG